MRDHWNKQLQLESAFGVSAFSLPRWLVGLVTLNKSDVRWAETALAHRVVSSDRLHQSQIARFKIKLFYRHIDFENGRYRLS